MTRKVLVFGSGAREHALAARLGAEGWDVTVAPGNAAIARQFRCVPAHLSELSPSVAVASSVAADFVVIGPEAPLVAGLADGLRAAGIATFGPSAKAARIEGSKAFAKEVMIAAGVPTARYEVFSDSAAARKFAADLGGRVAVKADGLAAGKGVVVCGSTDEADAAIGACLEERTLGSAGSTVVIEERLAGPEVSVFAICDGKTATVLPVSHDYKRLREGDLGPNTGGMGAVAPTPRWADGRGLLDLTVRPVLEELERRSTPFNGLLYAGVMLTPEGPRVIEYNCRFGDPETQVVMQVIEGALGEAMLAAAKGGRGASGLSTRDVTAVGVVAATAGYPEKPRLGDTVSGWEQAEAKAAQLFGAGVDAKKGSLVTAGGRVCTVVGVGRDLPAARGQAYGALSELRFEGRQARSDVGLPDAH